MSIQYIIGDVFENIDTAAFRLRDRLEHMLAVVEAYETKWEVERVPRPLCVDSGLDFITNTRGEAIGGKTKRTNYRSQLALCESCGFTEACLQMALAENRTIGIWGGTMPRDRVGQYA